MGARAARARDHRNGYGGRRIFAGDLLSWPVLGRFLRWRHARRALQLPMLLLAALLVFDGLFGPQLAPKNLATTGVWLHYRAFLVLLLLIAGNLFCMACPFMLPREAGRWIRERFLGGGRDVPRALRSKWLAVGLLVLFFYTYERFALWSSPWLTAWLIVGYFLAAFAVDTFFQGAAFCKYVCPVGQFNFFGSLVSPLEVKVREPGICTACTTKDCITLGRNTGKQRPTQAASTERPAHAAAPGRVRVEPAPVHLSLAAAAPASPISTFDRGCELWLFQQSKYGNQDCTFCLDCVHACPYDNVTIGARTPFSDLVADRFRSGVGHLANRLDLAALVAVLVFASHANAFAMIGPGYELRARLTAALGLRSDAMPLLLLLLLALLVAPALLLGAAAVVTRWLTASRDPVRELVARYLYGLVPLGISMWVAHYSFHFLTGALTLVPVAQSFLQDVGLRAADPEWGLGPVVPGDWLFPIEATFLYAGAFASLIVLVRIAERQTGARGALALRAAAPWIALCLVLLAAGLWILVQPMEMRGTMLAAQG